MALVVWATISPLGAHNGQFSLQLHGTQKFWVPSMQAMIDDFIRLGATGSGAQAIYTRGRKISPDGWHGESSAAAMIAWIAQWESIEGEVCSVVDAWGRTLPRVRMTNVMVQGAPTATRGPLISGATQVTQRADLSWTAEMLPTS